MAVQIGPDNVVGRDRLIGRIWKKLETSSLRFTAERRIGKTTVIRKMAAQPKDGMSLLFLDLERIDSSDRFTEVLLTEMKPLLSGKQVASDWFGSFLKGIGGTELGGLIKIPDQGPDDWQATLEKVFEGICLHNPDSTIVLLFDELPYMLQKIAVQEKEAAGKNAALQMLDTLRAMRDKHVNFRMIFAGSVGLHHVLAELRGTKFASQPVNDMPPIEINALAHPDAVTLAQRLVKTEAVNVKKEDSETLAEQLAILTDRVPFYLERIVGRLAEFDNPVSVKDAELVVRQHLTDDRDHWEMKHFRDRLKIYYVGTSEDANGKSIEKSKVASTVLDILAVATEVQTIDEVWSTVKARLALDDRDKVIELLSSLAQDHYLISDTEKCYSFRFPLIRQWWVLAQGLSQ